MPARCPRTTYESLRGGRHRRGGQMIWPPSSLRRSPIFPGICHLRGGSILDELRPGSCRVNLASDREE
jgi:hypothetical protein